MCILHTSRTAASSKFGTRVNCRNLTSTCFLPMTPMKPPLRQTQLHLHLRHRHRHRHLHASLHHAAVGIVGAVAAVASTQQRWTRHTRCWRWPRWTTRWPCMTRSVHVRRRCTRCAATVTLRSTSRARSAKTVPTCCRARLTDRRVCGR